MTFYTRLTKRRFIKIFVNCHPLIPLTIDGGGQQRGHNLPLAFLVFVEETLEAVEDSATEHKRLPLVHHRHEKHHDGRPANGGGEESHSEGTLWPRETAGPSLKSRLYLPRRV